VCGRGTSFLATAAPVADGSSGDVFFTTDAAAVIHEASGEVVEP
jgi:hypothetical protein